MEEEAEVVGEEVRDRSVSRITNQVSRIGKRQEVKGKRIRIPAVSRQLSELVVILIHKS